MPDEHSRNLTLRRVLQTGEKCVDLESWDVYASHQSALPDDSCLKLENVEGLESGLRWMIQNNRTKDFSTFSSMLGLLGISAVAMESLREKKGRALGSYTKRRRKEKTWYSGSIRLVCKFKVCSRRSIVLEARLELYVWSAVVQTDLKYVWRSWHEFTNQPSAFRSVNSFKCQDLQTYFESVWTMAN